MAHNHKERPDYSIPSSREHERISALFLGPKAENAELLKRCFDLIVTKQVEGRNSYFPNDHPFITQGIQGSPIYTLQTKQIYSALETLLNGLNEYSVPFYSPRYSAHMCVDQSMPAILGYLATMFYNPNNVAFEASPFTTLIELEVGRQLCKMLGFNTDTDASIEFMPLGWGHITCDGSVANLESIWASRNLKFYPLALRNAIDGKELHFIADSFNVEICTGETKLLKDLSVWEMLNLRVRTILEIPTRLQGEYGISGAFLDRVMKSYIVQSINKDTLMKQWGVEKQPVLFVPSTRHYSWPKGAAIAGIGSDSCKSIDVDFDARMKTTKLREELQNCLDRKQAVYMVVAVMGTTEEGAVDRLDEIINMRKEFQEKGLSFVVHADAAWGGYFASMIPIELYDKPTEDKRHLPDFVPQVGLREDTSVQLRTMMHADSVTIDPHKAGYVPYPAGSLCYRDGRMRYLLTWTVPYLNQGSSGESIGVYGVEGSKPGAAAAAVYLSHQVIGLGTDGMGSLLGEASFTCRRFSGHWAAMSDDKTSFIVVPLNRMPSELSPNSSPEYILEEKRFIRERILPKDNSQLLGDNEAMALLNKLGSDLNINLFACNFRYVDGTVNKDIEEANWLNRRIFEALSITSAKEDARDIPFYLTSSILAQSDYGECAVEFKRRLGLEGKQDLFVLRNVVMSPFTTTHDFVSDMAKEFQKVLEREVINVISRNTSKGEIHTFLVQGADKLYFVYQPHFHMASGRRQFIFSAELSEEARSQYKKFKGIDDSPAFMRNVKPLFLDDIEDGFSFQAEMYTKKGHGALPVNLNNVFIVKKRSLDPEDLDSSYPSLMPFYLYGTTEQMHIDHVLLLAPNIQLSSGKISGTFGRSLTSEELSEGLIAIATNIHEDSMQPFPTTKNIDLSKFFFRPGQKLDVIVFKDPFPKFTLDSIDVAHFISHLDEGLIKGTLTIEGEVFIDSCRLNNDEVVAHQAPFSLLPSGQMTSEAVTSWTDAMEKFHPKISQFQWSFPE